ncbi:MAG: family 4 glycosyl hydrolase [Promethearchaeota archaeon]
MVGTEKIVLIGAGSLQFGLGSVGNMLESKILEGSTICLHDINAETLELTYKACQSAIDNRKLDFTLEHTIDRTVALKNATFIINAIEVPPRFKLLDLDYRVPQEFGCKQITGENGGPGGLFHSLRVIPPILDICEDVHKICPNAYFINFSNPMSRICLAIKRKYPSLKFVGLCHEFQHFVVLVSRILDTPLSNLEIVGAGLNHFGNILDIKYKDNGSDAYPELRKRGPEFLRNIDTYDGFKLIAFLLETYGYCPYTTDSHYGEYVHWAWEYADIPAVRRFWKIYEEHLAGSFNEGIVTDSNHIEPSVNIPNDGIITNLPEDSIIECPAIINKNGVKGVKVGEYPKSIAALLQTQISVQDLVVEAIFKKSKDIALQALLADPVVETYWQAKRILDELLRVEADYIQIELD